MPASVSVSVSVPLCVSVCVRACVHGGPDGGLPLGRTTFRINVHSSFQKMQVVSKR